MNNMRILKILNEVLSKFQKKILAMKSIFQNEIIIQ
jgi:hypothetical protein